MGSQAQVALVGRHSLGLRKGTGSAMSCGARVRGLTLCSGGLGLSPPFPSQMRQLQYLGLPLQVETHGCWVSEGWRWNQKCLGTLGSESTVGSGGRREEEHGSSMQGTDPAGPDHSGPLLSYSAWRVKTGCTLGLGSSRQNVTRYSFM